MRYVGAVVLALTLMLAGLAMAGEMQGTIKSIDTAGKEVSLDNGTKLVLDDGTAIMMEGKEAKLEELKEGAKVKASYEEKDGKNVASKIEVE